MQLRSNSMRVDIPERYSVSIRNSRLGVWYGFISMYLQNHLTKSHTLSCADIYVYKEKNLTNDSNAKGILRRFEVVRDINQNVIEKYLDK